MKRLTLTTALVLASCAPSQTLPVAISAATDGSATASAIGSALKQHSRTFSFTGSKQTFKVPKRVHSITVDASGGGTKAVRARKIQNAFGGRTQATLPVTPGETLAIFVGGDGTTGFNGGGAGCGGGFGAGPRTFANMATL